VRFAGITLASRRGYGNYEPSYSKSEGFNISLIQPQGNDHVNGLASDGRYYATGFCPNCTGTGTSQINPTSTNQPFIFAVGPPKVAPYSSDWNAPLRRHLFYGRFVMDMTKSQGNNAPFLGNITSAGVIQTSFSQDGNYAENGHAFVMVFAMLIIFPLGIIMVRSLERVNLHVIFQSIGVGLVLLGLISGIAISLYYNRVRFPLPLTPIHISH
jgi:hypothetical protein